MIDIIQLENYRCFEKTQIKLKEIVVFVGKNNAGKTTIIQALDKLVNRNDKFGLKDFNIDYLKV